MTWADAPGARLGLQLCKESDIAQACLTLCNPMDCSLPGSSVHGILQARVLGWGAIAFSVKYSNDSVFFSSSFPLIIE